MRAEDLALQMGVAIAGVAVAGGNKVSTDAAGEVAVPDLLTAAVQT